MPVCGDAKVVGSELCDDGSLGGCLPDCSGANANFSCSGGSPTTPSVCVCSVGFSASGTLCLPTCGDGKMVGNEGCDDGNLGGCLSDCSGANVNFTCSGGSSSSQTICVCSEGMGLVASKC